jgi:hypothetical protein
VFVAGRRLIALLELALGVAIASCTPGAEQGSAGAWRAVTDTIGDTIVVRTVSGSVWGDTAELEPRTSIGMADGPDEYLIGSPGAIAVGFDGTVYVLDRQVPSLRAYTADGTFARDIGRFGSGPGEYRRPDGIAILSDGRLLVRDPGNGRISVFGPDGEYLEQWWLRGGLSTSRRFYVDREGRSCTMVVLNVDAAIFEWRQGLARYSANGTILDTLPAPHWDFEPADVVAVQDGFPASVNQVPFTPKVSWTYSPLGYTVGGVSTEYRIDLFRPGESVLRIERVWSPVAVHPEEAEEQRRRVTAEFVQEVGPWSWNGPPSPDSKPPFRNLFVSWEGDIWVLTSQVAAATMTAAEARLEEERTDLPPLRFREPVAFDVFAPDGRFLGHVRAPLSLQERPEPIVRGDTVWAVARDEMDVATIVRYQLVRPGAR